MKMPLSPIQTMYSVKISVKSDFKSKLTEKIESIFSCGHYLSFFTYPSKLPKFLLTYPSKLGESKNACSCIAKQTMKSTVRFGYENEKAKKG